MGAELFHADGRADKQTDKQLWQSFIVAFRNFAISPKSDNKINNFNSRKDGEFNIGKTLNGENIYWTEYTQIANSQGLADSRLRNGGLGRRLNIKIFGFRIVKIFSTFFY